LNYRNTLIAGNHVRLEEYSVVECLAGRHADLVLNENNWVADGTCEAAFSGDPLLMPLADNGGYTFTHVLSEDSPARYVVPQEGCLLEFDQRGIPRISPCDVGAVENE